jgi:hypothetical protein
MYEKREEYLKGSFVLASWVLNEAIMGYFKL